MNNGWPRNVNEELKPYFLEKKRNWIGKWLSLMENSCHNTHKLQSNFLQSLYANHPGISRMKAIYRSYFWWNGLDHAIEIQAKSYLACQAVKPAPLVSPLHPCIWPEGPWRQIHIDFDGPFMRKMSLIVIDAHSKWPKVIMPSTTSQHTINVLRMLFSRYGLPEQVVSDKGLNFVQKNLLAS